MAPYSSSGTSYAGEDRGVWQQQRSNRYEESSINACRDAYPGVRIYRQDRPYQEDGPLANDRPFPNDLQDQYYDPNVNSPPQPHQQAFRAPRQCDSQTPYPAHRASHLPRKQPIPLSDESSSGTDEDGSVVEIKRSQKEKEAPLQKLTGEKVDIIPGADPENRVAEEKRKREMDDIEARHKAEMNEALGDQRVAILQGIGLQRQMMMKERKLKAVCLAECKKKCEEEAAAKVRAAQEREEAEMIQNARQEAEIKKRVDQEFEDRQKRAEELKQQENDREKAAEEEKLAKEKKDNLKTFMTMSLFFLQEIESAKGKEQSTKYKERFVQVSEDFNLGIDLQPLMEPTSEDDADTGSSAVETSNSAATHSEDDSWVEPPPDRVFNSVPGTEGSVKKKKATKNPKTEPNTQKSTKKGKGEKSRGKHVPRKVENTGARLFLNLLGGTMQNRHHKKSKSHSKGGDEEEKSGW